MSFFFLLSPQLAANSLYPIQRLKHIRTDFLFESHNPIMPVIANYTDVHRFIEGLWSNGQGIYNATRWEKQTEPPTSLLCAV